MNPEKKKKLERAGFKVGTVQEFLGLTDEQAAKVEVSIDPRITAGPTATINAGFKPNPDYPGATREMFQIPSRDSNLVEINEVGDYERVQHPAHYGGADDPYEAIKVINAWQLDFRLGSVLKYIKRHGRKPEEGAEVDLKKAVFYLNDFIAELERARFARKARRAAEREQARLEAAQVVPSVRLGVIVGGRVEYVAPDMSFLETKAELKEALNEIALNGQHALNRERLRVQAVDRDLARRRVDPAYAGAVPLPLEPPGSRETIPDFAMDAHPSRSMRADTHVIEMTAMVEQARIPAKFIDPRDFNALSTNAEIDADIQRAAESGSDIDAIKEMRRSAPKKRGTPAKRKRKT